MKSSPKPDETPISAGSKTPASGKKLVQARLPFKTLSGSEPPLTPSTNETSTAAIELPTTPNETKPMPASRKRKQTTTITSDEVRAPKIKKDLNNDDDLILVSSETIETSCDLTVNDNDNDNDKNSDDEDRFNRSSESKENVCLENEIVISDTENENVETIENDTKKTPKAKQSLSFTEPKSETRKSKRISDVNSFKIKLPPTKKAKEAAKKSKKQRKSEHKEDGSSSDDKTDSDESKKQRKTTETMDTDGPASTSKHDDSIFDDNIVDEASDFDKSQLNNSIVSNVSLCDDPKTPNNQKLTPKQLQRKAESEKKALERQRAKIERDRKIQEEKMQKQREREEKEEQRKREKEERERKIQEEKEERERQKQREKEERERKVQEEKELKLREKEEKRKEREEKGLMIEFCNLFQS